MESKKSKNETDNQSKKRITDDRRIK